MTTRQIFTEDMVLIASPDSCKRGLVIMELTEEIDEAGIREVACDCGTGGDSWSTFRMCL